jgi:hypothetical protein
MNDAHGGAHAMLQAGDGAGRAGTARERASPSMADSPRPALAPVNSECAPAGATSLRLVQVYLTPGIDEFLRQARSLAIMQNLDVTASAVVRHAVERLMATTSPAEIVDLLGSPKGQSQPRRGRPRR